MIFSESRGVGSKGVMEAVAGNSLSPFIPAAAIDSETVDSVINSAGSSFPLHLRIYPAIASSS